MVDIESQEEDVYISKAEVYNLGKKFIRTVFMMDGVPVSEVEYNLWDVVKRADGTWETTNSHIRGKSNG